MVRLRFSFSSACSIVSTLVYHELSSLVLVRAEEQNATQQCAVAPNAECVVSPKQEIHRPPRHKSPRAESAFFVAGTCFDEYARRLKNKRPPLSRKRSASSGGPRAQQEQFPDVRRHAHELKKFLERCPGSCAARLDLAATMDVDPHPPASRRNMQNILDVLHPAGVGWRAGLENGAGSPDSWLDAGLTRALGKTGFLRQELSLEKLRAEHSGAPPDRPPDRVLVDHVSKCASLALRLAQTLEAVGRGATGDEDPARAAPHPYLLQEALGVVKWLRDHDFRNVDKEGLLKLWNRVVDELALGKAAQVARNQTVDLSLLPIWQWQRERFPKKWEIQTLVPKEMVQVDNALTPSECAAMVDWQKSSGNSGEPLLCVPALEFAQIGVLPHLPSKERRRFGGRNPDDPKKVGKRLEKHVVARADRPDRQVCFDEEFSKTALKVVKLVSVSSAFAQEQTRGLPWRGTSGHNSSTPVVDEHGEDLEGFIHDHNSVAKSDHDRRQEQDPFVDSPEPEPPLNPLYRLFRDLHLPEHHAQGIHAVHYPGPSIHRSDVGGTGPAGSYQEQGAGYGGHVDCIRRPVNREKQLSHPERHLTVIVYLNDDAEGGGTSFPRLSPPQKIQPRCGRVVLFNNLERQVCTSGLGTKCPRGRTAFF